MINSDTHNWAHDLFGEADLGDQRRTNRLLRNESVGAESIAHAGFETYAKYAQGHSSLLALEDTTTLTYLHKSVQDEPGHVAGSKFREDYLHIPYCRFHRAQSK